MIEPVRNYCSVDDVKSYLGTEDAYITCSVDFDNFLQLAIEMYSSEIDCMTFQTIGLTDKVITFKGNDTTYKALKYFPVNSINYVKYKSNQPTETFACMDPTSYELQDFEGAAFVHGFTNWNRDFLYMCSFNYGWDPIPRKIREICVEGAVLIYRQSGLRGEGWLGKASKSEVMQGISGSTVYKDMYKEHTVRLRSWTRTTT